MIWPWVTFGIMSWLISSGVVVLPATQLGAEQVATQPALVGASEAVAPEPDVQPQVTVDAEAQAWLEKLEQQSSGIKTLSAKLRYDRIQGLVGDEQRRFGTLLYVVGPPARFALHFDRLLVDRRLEKQNRWYVFDGRWLIERQDDQKLFIKREVVSPDAQVSQADPLALGSGPFPVPIHAKKADLVRRFIVTVQAAEKDDPANTVHLRLVPREGQRSDFVHIDLWHDRDTLLPVRVRTLDASENESIIEVIEPKVNQPVDEKQMQTDEPREAGWRVEVTPWQGT